MQRWLLIRLNQVLIIMTSKERIGATQNLAVQSRKNVSCIQKLLLLEAWGFAIVGKVDADHARETVVRRSRTEFIVCLNSAPVCWFSKK